MNNNKLVEEISERILAIIMADAGNNIIPKFNQAKTIPCVNAEFCVHEDLTSELQLGIFLNPLATYLNSRWIELKALRRFLSNNSPPRLSFCPSSVLHHQLHSSLCACCHTLNTNHNPAQSVKYFSINRLTTRSSPLDIPYYSTILLNLGVTGLIPGNAALI
jgi:hypothetical protein